MPEWFHKTAQYLKNLLPNLLTCQPSRLHLLRQLDGSLRFPGAAPCTEIMVHFVQNVQYINTLCLNCELWKNGVCVWTNLELIILLMLYTVNSHSQCVTLQWSEEQMAPCDAQRESYYTLTLYYNVHKTHLTKVLISINQVRSFWDKSTKKNERWSSFQLSSINLS